MDGDAPRRAMKDATPPPLCPRTHSRHFGFIPGPGTEMSHLLPAEAVGNLWQITLQLLANQGQRQVSDLHWPHGSQKQELPRPKQPIGYLPSIPQHSWSRCGLTTDGE